MAPLASTGDVAVKAAKTHAKRRFIIFTVYENAHYELVENHVAVRLGSRNICCLSECRDQTGCELGQALMFCLS